jgi:serine/threonine-protein kinase
MSANAAAPPGERRQLSRYLLLYRFAIGGMASVYLARLTGAEGFEKLIAVKVIHEHLAQNPTFVKMFIDEARVASRITHPNVVQIIELGRDAGAHFIAMEYVDGDSLVALLARKQPSIPICARIVADAASGLHAAHELRGRDGQPLGVVHRDVSPQNILISYGGAVKVLDFGVARARDNVHTTDDGTVRGKFAYMSPEQLTANPVDRRSDIFSLGIILYETTTYRRLFRKPDHATTVTEILHGTIIPPSKLPGIKSYPPALEQIVMRALEKQPEKRFQTALELQQALERFIVASGSPVLPADVGQLMGEVFADRMKEKEERLRRCEAGEPIDVEEARGPDVPKSGSSMDLDSAGGTWRRARRRNLIIVVSLALLAAAGGLLISHFALRPAPPPDRASPAADGPRRRDARPADVRAAATASDSTPRPEITIWISAPEEATIRFDGNPVENPFRVKQPARDGQATVVVSAPGRVSRHFVVPLDKGGRWKISLPPVKGAKKGVGDDAIRFNPYKKR